MDWNQPIRRRTSQAVPLAPGAPQQTFAAQRVCDHEQCTVRLSRYNPSSACGKHRGWRDEPKTRTRRAHA
jgi:hypothetical protein